MVRSWVRSTAPRFEVRLQLIPGGYVGTCYGEATCTRRAGTHEAQSPSHLPAYCIEDCMKRPYQYFRIRYFIYK